MRGVGLGDLEGVAGRERRGGRRLRAGLGQASRDAVGPAIGARLLTEHLDEGRSERALRPGECDPVLGPRRTGDARLDRGQVQLDRLGVGGIVVGIVEQPLLLGVRLDEGDQLLWASRELEVAEGLVVDGEDRARRAVLGRHVPDGGPVLEGDGSDAGAVELDELPNDTPLTEDLASDRLPRGRLTAHPLGALTDARTGRPDRSPHGPTRGLEDDLREVLEVDLMADAGVGRHDAQVVEGGLAPT